MLYGPEPAEFLTSDASIQIDIGVSNFYPVGDKSYLVFACESGETGSIQDYRQWSDMANFVLLLPQQTVAGSRSCSVQQTTGQLNPAKFVLTIAEPVVRIEEFFPAEIGTDQTVVMIVLNAGVNGTGAKALWKAGQVSDADLIGQGQELTLTENEAELTYQNSRYLFLTKMSFKMPDAGSSGEVTVGIQVDNVSTIR